MPRKHEEEEEEEEENGRKGKKMDVAILLIARQQVSGIERMHNERDIPDVTPTDGWRGLPRDGERGGRKKQHGTPSCRTVG